MARKYINEPVTILGGEAWIGLDESF